MIPYSGDPATSTKGNSLLLILLDGIFTHNHDKDVQTCGVETEGVHGVCSGDEK